METLVKFNEEQIAPCGSTAGHALPFSGRKTGATGAGMQP